MLIFLESVSGLSCFGWNFSIWRLWRSWGLVTKDEISLWVLEISSCTFVTCTTNKMCLGSLRRALILLHFFRMNVSCKVKAGDLFTHLRHVHDQETVRVSEVKEDMHFITFFSASKFRLSWSTSTVKGNLRMEVDRQNLERHVLRWRVWTGRFG